MTTTSKTFRLRDYVKDPALAALIQRELSTLAGDSLERAQEAVIETAGVAGPGTYDQLATLYRRAIRRAADPGQKLAAKPEIDPALIKNPELRARLSREFAGGVTEAEVGAANAALRRLLEEMRAVQVVRTSAEGERFVRHAPSRICPVDETHSTLRGGESRGCGYYRTAEEWEDEFRATIRAALER